MNRYNIRLNNKTYDVLVKECLDNRAMFDINGKRYMIDRTAPIMDSIGVDMVNFPRVNTFEQPPVPRAESTPTATVKESIVSPLPGSVLEILCKNGACVKAGETVIKLEAMKMETEIQSQISGTIQSIKINIGDSVQQGQVLIDIA